MMKSILHIFVLIYFLSFVVYSQTPQPTSTPPEDKDIVKITTTLIQIDATVTDSRGRIVADLKADEFEIYENGKKQEITNFSFISNKGKLNKSVSKRTAKGQIASVPYPPSVTGKILGRTIALVVDDLTLSSSSMSAVRRGLRKYINNQMLPGDFVAIIKTGGGSGALQQFTSDKRRLNAVIDQLRWNPNGKGGISAFDPIGGLTGSGIPPREDVVPNLFHSLKNIIHSMKPIPGRKSVMLISDGFSLTASPSLELETDVRNEGDTTTTRYLGIAKELIKLANRSSVVIYTMDARGVQYTGVTAADNTTVITGVPAANPTLNGLISGRRNKLAETRSGLKFVAEQTGGFAIINNNDIGKGIKKVVQDQSYYLIGYQPNEETFDAKISRFNKLQIKVKRKGVKVRYRTGFFGSTKDDENTDSIEETGIVAAIRSPYSVNEVDLNLNALFAIDRLGKIKVRSFLHIDANDLKFTDSTNGKKTASVEILAVSYDSKGKIENQFSKSHKITVDKKKYQEIERDGLIYYFVFPVKKGGAYEMRVALRDEDSGKTGTASQFIKIPKQKKKRLTLSGIVLENLTSEQWKKRQEDNADTTNSTTPLLDNALRRFKLNSVMTYGFEIYNVKTDSTAKANMVLRTRLFHNGNLIHNGKNSAIGTQNPKTRIWSASGALNLHSDLKPGAYVLQIVITDKLAKKKRQIATQFVQFEIAK